MSSYSCVTQKLAAKPPRLAGMMSAVAGWDEHSVNIPICLQNSQWSLVEDTIPETNSLNLKMDGWKKNGWLEDDLFLFGMPSSQVLWLLVAGERVNQKKISSDVPWNHWINCFATPKPLPGRSVMKEAAMGTTKRCIMVSRPRVSPASFAWSLNGASEPSQLEPLLMMSRWKLNSFLCLLVGEEFLMMTLVFLHHVLESWKVTCV